MARFVGHALGRTPAETLQQASGYLSEKEMPKANVPARGKRFSPRQAAKVEPDALRQEPAADEAQD
ncbi:hypothetical protein [Enterovirga aerilata]|uniref:Uncharacterized protein n=1 Tax=Enterovirga aerilata TaxID=2730920 RepID=A0A849IAZ0_9HYPH|nr:hypothetical protein [Enterovirga sp. DB1703]NNM73425.1 hypothetical protein [Enterovirga sp. DB1703]